MEIHRGSLSLTLDILLDLMHHVIQEERKHNASLRGEVQTLEGVLEKSGDQTKEELITLKQMFEQSEQSRVTCKHMHNLQCILILCMRDFVMCCHGDAHAIYS